MWPCAWRRHCRARAVVAHGVFQRRRLLPHAHTMRLARATRTRAFIQSPLSGSLGAGSRDEAQGRPRAGLRDLAFRGMGGGPPLPRVGGRKEAWEAGSGGAPFPRPPEVRRKRGSAPFGSESLSPNSALVTRWGVALLFSDLTGSAASKGASLSYVFCSLAISISITGVGARRLLCLYPKLVSQAGARCPEHLAQALGAPSPMGCATCPAERQCSLLRGAVRPRAQGGLCLPSPLLLYVLGATSDFTCHFDFK